MNFGTINFSNKNYSFFYLLKKYLKHSTEQNCKLGRNTLCLSTVKFFRTQIIIMCFILIVIQIILKYRIQNVLRWGLLTDTKNCEFIPLIGNKTYLLASLFGNCFSLFQRSFFQENYLKCFYSCFFFFFFFFFF